MKQATVNRLPASRFQSRNVTKGEKWIGYLAGPAGALLAGMIYMLFKTYKEATKLAGKV